MHQLSTAIIYFSRLPGEEIRHKTFCSRNERLNGIIASKLFEHTAATIGQTGLDNFYYSEKQQQGNSFGERVSNAMQEVFAKGYNSIIVVGSDTPNLTTKLILQAREQLQKQPVVAGPTQLGGTYLIGIRREAFNNAAFVSLPWQTDELIRAMASFTPGIFLLPLLREINTAGQLLYFLHSSHTAELSFGFLQVIKSWINNFWKTSLSTFLPQFFSLYFSPGRAP